MHKDLEITIKASFLFTYLIKLNQVLYAVLEKHSQFTEPDTASVWMWRDVWQYITWWGLYVLDGAVQWSLSQSFPTNPLLIWRLLSSFSTVLDLLQSFWIVKVCYKFVSGQSNRFLLLHFYSLWRDSTHGARQ